MQVLLAYKCHEKGADDYHTSLLPVGLVSLHAVLCNSGYQSTLANFSTIDWSEIEAHLAAIKPDLLGLSQFTHNRAETIRIAKIAKKLNPGCFVILGGPHATYTAQQTLVCHPEVDAVLLGESEETLPELLHELSLHGAREIGLVKGLAFRAGTDVVFTAARAPIQDLDGLPLAARYINKAIGVDVRRQLEFIITSRGCPAACKFCSSPGYWGRKLRFRSPASIVEEICYIRDRYGLLYFSIRDDTFTADRSRVLDFCRMIVDQQIYVLWNCQSRVNAVDEEMLFWMKRAGCECVQFGVESGSPSMLKTLGKRITPDEIIHASAAVRKAGMNLSVYLVTGIPGETEQDLQKSIQLLDRIRPHDGQVSPLVYYPGTALFTAAVASGTFGPRIFEDSPDEAFHVRKDKFVMRSTKALMKSLGRVAGSSRFTLAELTTQKKLLGFCFSTNMLAGELFEELGEWGEAEREYREITVRQPGNPWGWLLLGELCERTSDLVRGKKSFEQVIKLVPRHAPAFTAMGELCLAAGDRKGASAWFSKALLLEQADNDL
jgi:radical SAM superfamily enzyme YgiQ (UPF0313 family)